MVLCVAADVRVHVNPSSILDADITTIISKISTEILTKAGSIDETNPYLIQACIHAVAAIVLKRARASGEYASSVETPDSKISIDGINDEIKQHEEERDYYISQYRTYSTSTYSSPSFNVGFASHHHHHGGH